MSGIATGTALAIGLGASAAGGIASAAIGGSAAQGAAQTQAGAEKNALQFQEQEWQQQQQNEAPFLQAGTQGANSLASLLGTPGAGLLAPYGQQFSAPTAQQAEQMPGYQFQLGQGTQAINENAAATGNLLSGNTGTALENYGQGLAQTDYNNLYNQALNTYMTNYGVWNQGQTNTYNRLSGLAGMGANAAANLGSQGQAAAQNAGNELVGQGTALASGQVGEANAITGGINSITGAASQLPLYQLLAQQSNQSSYNNTPTPVGNINFG